MPTISLCMIVKNEEDVLARCLDCIKDIADEIIIVDTGSQDRTKEIADGYTDRVFFYQWKDDFASARNYSFSKATMDYCMWLDADDIITEKEQARLMALKSVLDPEVDVVMMKYLTSFDQQGNCHFSFYRERLLKNGRGFIWNGRVHEAITPSGRIVYSDIEIEHRKIGGGSPDRNLGIYQRMIAEGETLEPRHQFYYARELYYHQKYEEAAGILEQFLEEKDAWVENRIEGCLHLSYCYGKLGQLEKALKALMGSFCYDRPRAEICCEIGRHFADQELWEIAAFWYGTALQTPRKDESGGFVLDECYGYLPAIELCVCYDRMGKHKEAYEYHLLAKKWNPASQAVKINQKYFDNLNPL